MDIRQLIFFVELKKQGSINKAAKELHITPSGMRLSLHRLEDELETELIQWGAKELTLTENGEYFVKRARDMIDVYESSIEHFRQSAPEPELNIASGINFPSMDIGKAIDIFSEENSHVKVTLTDYTGAACDDAVYTGIAEIGFNTGPFVSSEFDIIPLFDYKMYAVAGKVNELTKKESVSAEDLKDYLISLVDVKPGDQIFGDYCAEKGLTQTSLSRIKRDAVMFRRISEDPHLVGITYKEAFNDMRTDGLALLPLNEDVFKKTVYMFHKKGAVLSKQAYAFKELLLKLKDRGLFDSE